MPEAVLRSQVVTYLEHDGTEEVARRIAFRLAEAFKNANVEIDPDDLTVRAITKDGIEYLTVPTGKILAPSKWNGLRVTTAGTFFNSYRQVPEDVRDF